MAGASDLEKQWKKLEQLRRSQETISYFCHCTSKENKEKIKKEDKLKGHSASKPDWLPLAEKTHLKGVFFMVSLYWGPRSAPGGLPTISPYGEHRIKIPVEEIIGDDVDECNLYFESDYEHGGVRYVRIVLVKDHQERAKKWCDKNLHSIDRDNNILKLTKRGELKCVVSYDYKDENPKLYTEVFVVGDVEDLEEKEAEWDKVRVTGRGSY